MKVLGIDPGYERLGVAIVEKEKGKETLLFSTCFRSNPKLPHQKRLAELAENVEVVIAEWQPHSAAFEDLFFNTNQKTALNVAEVVGVLRFLANKANMKVYEYTPSQVKVAVSGYGRANKEQVMSMVKKLLKIEKKEMLDDEFDAIAIALTHLASIREV